jgi:hypothetical protein
MAGPAPGLAARWTGVLAARVREMQLIVADQARASQARSPITGRRLDHAQRRMPIDGYHPLAFAPFDADVIAVHRSKHRQALHPIDAHPERVVVT